MSGKPTMATLPQPSLQATDTHPRPHSGPQALKRRARASLMALCDAQNQNGLLLTYREHVGEAEPRRSVRATKGQHTKTFDELEPAPVKRRQTKKSKKALEQEQSQEPEEVIRCVCGASEQDEDSGEAWIACETCQVWQHNVCVGVSSYEDEIPDHYWCEQCRPQDHQELLDGIAKGEKPWEARRKAHEEEVEKKKKKGGRKGKGKRVSDSKEDLEKDTAAATKAKASPAPDAVVKEKKEPVAKPGKRKSRDESQDAEGKVRTSPKARQSMMDNADTVFNLQVPKIRRISETESVPVTVKYKPPEDLATSIATLPGTRVGPAKALKKSISHIIATLAKSDELDMPEDSTSDGMADMFALQIERAVFDTHPLSKGQKEYTQQIKSLTFNLKNNPELIQGLLQGMHSPLTLAIMTSDQLASAEMQRQTAEMKAKAEKQSILYTADTGPRVRRTHKGEEVVEDESMLPSEAPMPISVDPRRPALGEQTPQSVKRESIGGDDGEMMARQSESQQQSPSEPNFDISKVFSSVKSPTGALLRRPSAPVLNTSGPGIDLDVDRLLEDENDSPPYSPTEEAQDPDVVWRGTLAMSSIADFQATAKHVGGANFSAFGPWSKLIPAQMTVAGRITQQSAVEYLCSLRYSNLTDIVVVNITPVSPDSKQEFQNLINYFVNKNRYGVVGNKVAGNVRDTYLVPVPAGEDGHPEFMLNLVDNYIPKSRAEPLLLAVFVYRNEPEQLKIAKDQPALGLVSPTVSGTPTPAGHSQRNGSTSGPGFSPATPQGAFHMPPNSQSATPVPIPQPSLAPPPTRPTPPAATGVVPPPSQMTEAQKFQAQQAGHVMAQEVLGPLISVPTVQFLLPQAFQMSRREWEVIRSIYERDTRAREDLQHLATLLEKHNADGDNGSDSNTNSTPPSASTAGVAVIPPPGNAATLPKKA